MRALRNIVGLTLGLLLGVGVTSAYAHAFGERYDLPIPLNYFLFGGAATVALSFVVIGIFVKRSGAALGYPRHNLLATRGVGALIASRPLLWAIKLLSFGLFALVLATSFFGSNRPLDVLSPTFVWIIWWVGMGYAAALFGNLWALVNPWKIAYEWAEKAFGGNRRGSGALFPYPQGLDVWPATVLFLLFAWLENVYLGATIPSKLGMLVLLYSLITWGGMLAFGKHTWLRRGEAFSVLFGFFARFSPTEARVSNNRLCARCGQECGSPGVDCVDCYDCFERANPRQREFNLRPYAVGLAHPGRVSTATAAFVILALATVTFDGLQETPTWVDIQTFVYDAASLFGPNVVGTIDTFGLVVLPTIFMLIYLGFARAIRWLSGDPTTTFDVAKAFVFALVPIALAYNMAHFMSLLLITGQSIIPLFSDPFGYGWDIFRTADYKINIGIINARFAWYTSVAAIVLGHVISVYLAHLISLRRVQDRARALRGQYPMLALMVIYTATSLWIIAQPIVEG